MPTADSGAVGERLQMARPKTSLTEQSDDGGAGSLLRTRLRRDFPVNRENTGKSHQISYGTRRELLN